MKFVITKASSDDYMTIRDFPTVESLITFMKEQDNPLILDNNFWYKEKAHSVSNFSKINPDELVSIPYSIHIYDDYIE